jgi:cytochrome c-type biogenesis protein CcmF
MALAFHTGWAPRAIPATRLLAYGAMALVLGLVAATLLGGSPLGGVTLLGLAAASVLFLSLDIARTRPTGRLLAGHVAHLGMALVLVGAAGSSLGEDFSAPMAPGERVQLAHHEVELESIDTGESDRYIFVAADVTVSRDGGSGVTMSPQIRAYEEQALPVPEPALHSTLWEDVVVAISRVSEDALVVEVSVFVRPLVTLVWVGAILISLGGVLALAATGAGAARRRRSARAGQQPAGTPISG